MDLVGEMKSSKITLEEAKNNQKIFENYSKKLKIVLNLNNKRIY